MKRLVYGIFILLAVGISLAQQPAPPQYDAKRLLQSLKDHQRKIDQLRGQYSYRETAEFLTLDDQGNVTRRTVSDYKMFFVNTHPVRVLEHRNGQPLDEDAAASTREHLVKDTARAQRAAPGDSTDGTMSVWSLLETMKFTNPRHVQWQGRPTLLLDFASDPDIKSSGMAESVARRFHGQLWIDEQDWEVAHLESHLDDTMRWMGGIVLQVEKGSRVVMDQQRVNDEIWLPSKMDVEFSGRAFLLKGFRQVIHLRDDQYVKASNQQVAKLASGGR